MSKSHYIIPIFVPHEGCPHNCVFCNQNSITGNREVIDKAYVRNTIEEYLKTIDKIDSTIEVSFFGGTFTAISLNKQRELLGVAKQYKDEKKIHYIRLSTRPDYIDKEILDNLKSFNVDIIELGVQSMDKEVLYKAGRGHTAEDVIKASNLIKDYGFILGHQIMLGLPGDTPEKDVDSAKTLIDLKPDLFRIYPALVIKDTPMEYLYRLKKYSPYDLSKTVEVAKEIYCLLLYNNINVIRVGLQTTDNINVGKDIIAGPFHPAFRELVEGSLYCEVILDFVKESKEGLKIFVNDRDISKLYADKKQFFIDMKKHLNTSKVEVKADPSVERGTLTLQLGETCSNVSINDFIYKKVKEGNLKLS